MILWPSAAAADDDELIRADSVICTVWIVLLLLGYHIAGNCMDRYTLHASPLMQLLLLNQNAFVTRKESFTSTHQFLLMES